jgi:hypothetical protein
MWVRIGTFRHRAHKPQDQLNGQEFVLDALAVKGGWVLIDVHGRSLGLAVFGVKRRLSGFSQAGH